MWYHLGKQMNCFQLKKWSFEPLQWAIKMGLNTSANRLSTLANWTLAKRLVSETTDIRHCRLCLNSWVKSVCRKQQKRSYKNRIKIERLQPSLPLIKVTPNSSKTRTNSGRDFMVFDNALSCVASVSASSFPGLSSSLRSWQRSRRFSFS